ncbi:MAG: DUF1223 domain-containing protein [Hyphomonadaceae bacterium]|jgi:hypothetical protein|nr:DUF1223 domain-containing protein [Hyphomonadaceae bacterium]
MRFVALIALAAGFAGFAGLAQAQRADGVTLASHNASHIVSEPKAVVELYTSQSCAACPAADAVLNQLAKRDDIIAVSLSVDYWDYLGWKDTLAQPKFSERQKAYAKVLGDGMIYTPQMVVNGAVHVNGTDELKISAAIEKTNKTVALSHVPVNLSATDDKLTIKIGAAPLGSAVREATVWLGVLSPSVQVPIARGENKGKTITYSNVVRDLMPIGMWNGRAMTVQLQRNSIMHTGADRCVVLVQQGPVGPIVGAAIIKNF